MDGFFLLKKNIQRSQTKIVGYLHIFIFQSENIALKFKVYNIKKLYYFHYH